MKSFAVILVIAAALLSPVPVTADSGSAGWADPTEAHPYFVRADTQQSGAWTGYRATIQVRPLTYAVWPGGYLEDGTFVQNGLVHPYLDYPDSLWAFAWAPNGGAYPAVEELVVADLGPTRYDFGPTTRGTIAKPGSWITFEMYWSRGIWTFRYQDATGWHKQASFRSNSKLRSVQFMVEQWGVTNPAFRTQVMRDVQVRTAAGKWIAPNLAYSSGSDEQCGVEQITRTAPSSLVFKMATNAPCYKSLPAPR